MSDEKTYNVSIVKNRKTMEPIPKSMTWEALTDLAAAMSVKASGKDGPGIVPCHLREGEGRTKKTKGRTGRWRQEHLAGSVSILCLDIEDHDFGTDDKDTLIEALTKKLPDTQMLVYTTHSHGVREVDGKEKWKPGHPRMRVVIPLQTPVEVDDYGHLYTWAKGYLPGVDRSCSDPVRISYLPRKKAGDAELDPWIEIIDGALLDTQNLFTPEGVTTSIAAIKKAEAKRREYAKSDASEFAGRRGLEPDQLEEALSHIEDNESYHMWLKIGMALHDYHIEGRLTESEAIGMWDKWSQGASNYESYESIEAAFRGFSSEQKSSDRRVTIGTLIHYAVEGGWSAPRKAFHFFRGDDVEIRDRLLDDSYRVGERRSINARYLWSNDQSQVGKTVHGDVFYKALPEADVVHGFGTVWRYDIDEGVWAELSKAEVVNRVTKYAGYPVRVGEDKTRALSISAGKGRSVYDLVEAKAIDERPNFFDGSHRSIATKNAVLAVDKNDVVIEIDDNRSPLIFGCRHKLQVEWAPEADYTEWDDFLYSCFLPGFHRYEDGRISHAGSDDPQEYSDMAMDAGARIVALQKYVGAALFGQATKTQKALMLVGPGGGGKSVFLKIIESLFRAEDIASVPPQKMGMTHENITLATAALNICYDVDRSELLETGTLKQVIVGDRIGFNRKYGDVFNEAPTCGHAFSCNELPHANDHSKGFWDRWLLISFPRMIRGTDEEDKGIVERLMSPENRAKVLKWAVEGFIQWVRDGKRIHIPQSSRDLMTDWQEDSNPIVEFIEAHRLPENADRSRNSWTKASVLYDSFVAFCQRVGRKQWTRQRFYKEMAALANDPDFDLDVWDYRRTKYYPLRSMVMLDTLHDPMEIPSVPTGSDDV